MGTLITSRGSAVGTFEVSISCCLSTGGVWWVFFTRCIFPSRNFYPVTADLSGWTSVGNKKRLTMSPMTHAQWLATLAVGIVPKAAKNITVNMWNYVPHSSAPKVPVLFQ